MGFRIELNASHAICITHAMIICLQHYKHAHERARARSFEANALRHKQASAFEFEIASPPVGFHVALELWSVASSFIYMYASLSNCLPEEREFRIRKLNI